MEIHTTIYCGTGDCANLNAGNLGITKQAQEFEAAAAPIQPTKRSVTALAANLAQSARELASKREESNLKARDGDSLSLTDCALIGTQYPAHLEYGDQTMVGTPFTCMGGTCTWTL